MALEDKRRALAEVRQHLVVSLKQLRREVTSARSGTRVDGDHRPANRGERGAVTSQGYLAGALAGRVAMLEEALRQLDLLAPGRRERVAPGALVAVEDDDGQVSRFLVAPGAAALRLTSLPDVVALSPSAPKVRALYGARVGDAEVIELGGRELTLEIVAID